MNKITNWVFGSFFRTLGRVLVYLVIGFLVAYALKDTKMPKIRLSDLLFMNVNALEGLTSSGESIANSTKIGSRYVGSNYYYEFSSGTYDQSALDLDIGIEYNGDLTGTGTTDVKFYVDYCVNGSIPDFAIYSSYVNNVEYSYSLNKSIYLSNGEWSKAQCYRSFITLNLNYTSGCSVQGTNCLTTLTDNNNTFALLGNYGYNVLLRYNDLVYLNSSDYSSLLNQAKIESANNTIIEQNNTINNSINNSSTNIINNQNSNTQDIIDNQNSNIDKEIESQKVCDIIDSDDILERNKYLNSQGQVITTSSNNVGITDYINIFNSTLEMVESGSGSSKYCFYTDNKTIISCSSIGTLIDIPSNAKFIRTSIYNNKPIFKICKNGNQAIGDNLSDINNSLTDDSPPTNLDSLNNSAGWLPAGPVDSILNLPLSFLTNLNTNLSKSCQPVNLPLPYINKNLPLPCVNTLYNEINGLPNWINIIGTIASAFILFGYFINLYKYVDDTLTFRENNYIDNWSGV